MRFVPFTALRKEEQDDDELVSVRPAPVQPAGYGMDSTGQDPVENIAERDLVQRVMAQMPEALRLCLVLSIVGGLPAHQVARVLGLSNVAVRQRLSRARRLFQQLYLLLESGDGILDGSLTLAGAVAHERKTPLVAPSQSALAECF